jgi:ribosome-binding protein aMBF1 (putative translation factor)
MPDENEDIHPIKKARYAKGLSARGLAWELGINLYSFTQVNLMERGTYLPGPKRAEKIAEVLGFESGPEVRRLCDEWLERNPRPEENLE